MASQLDSSPYLNHPAPSSPSPSPPPSSTSSSSSSTRRHHSHNHSHSHSHHSHNQQNTPDTNTPTTSTKRHHSSHRSSSSRPRSSSVNNERSSRRHTSKHSHNNNNNNGHSSHPTYHAHHPRPGGLLSTTSTSAKTTPMHDDTDAGRLIPVNPPAAAIDYLGNGWSNEDDIAASWKFMTKQKNDLINGLRLENASWRNWAKQRHNLKTISPKSLNWLKDSDTTWLYGPLYKAAIDEFDRSRFGAQTVAVAGGGSVSIPTTPTHEILVPILPTDLASVISTSTPTTTQSAPSTPPASITSGVGARRSGLYKSGGPLKPVLKHKTASELFKADTLFHVQSDLRLHRKIEPFNKAGESAVFKQHRQPKLRFNDSVEQCVSIDTDVISEEDEESLANDNNNNVDISRSNSNGNGKDDEDARAGLNGRHEDEDGGLLMRISARKPPRSIVRIDSTTLKAASLHGMQDDGLEDPEDASTTDDEDEEGLFDEPIYLGNPYTGSGTAYVGSRHDAPHEAVLDDVSYTRPSPPSPSAGSTVSANSSASSEAFYSASSTPVSNSSDMEEQLLQPETQQQQQPISSEQPTPIPQQQPPSQQQQTGTYVVTHTSSPRTISTSFLEQPVPVSTTTTTTPAPSAARTALASALEAEKALAANGGMQQRATDLVANVKGLVNWASSLVFNSSAF